MAVDKKFFVDINLQGSALNNATIGSNSDMTKGGSFRYNESEFRLEYFDGTNTQPIANLADISAVTGGLIFQTGVDCSGATPDPDITTGIALKGQFWVVETAGSFLGQSVQVGDSIIAKVDAAGASIADWLILQGNVVIATDSVDGIVRLATQAEVDAGTEGGAVVLTPATFANSQQLADINNNIAALANDKLSRDGSQAMEGNLDMGGNDIGNVNDTATASLSGIAGADISLQNNIDGNGVSNLVNIPAPNNGGDAANKTYVDDQDALKLSLTGGTMSGNIDMGTLDIDNVGIINVSSVAGIGASAVNLTYGADANNNKITSVSAPTDGTDAANKDYVDSASLTAENNAKAYADSLAPNYDPAGAAATAESNANSYTDSAIAQEVIDRDAAIATAKSEAITDANTYTDNQTTVKFVDTTAWVLDGDFYYAEVLHTLGSYVNFTILNSIGQVVEFAVTMGSGGITLFSNTLPSSHVLVLLSKVNSNS